jgi:hypothetical protein
MTGRLGQKHSVIIVLASSLPTRRQKSCVISERFAMVSWGGTHVTAAAVHGRFPLCEITETQQERLLEIFRKRDN